MFCPLAMGKNQYAAKTLAIKNMNEVYGLDKTTLNDNSSYIKAGVSEFVQFPLISSDLVRLKCKENYSIDYIAFFF